MDKEIFPLPSVTFGGIGSGGKSLLFSSQLTSFSRNEKSKSSKNRPTSLGPRKKVL